MRIYFHGLFALAISLASLAVDAIISSVHVYAYSNKIDGI